MIIIQVAGGLGNQMQQYALYRKLISLGIDTRLDISWFTEYSRQDGVYARRELELNYFEGLEYKVCTEEEKRAVIGNGGLLGKVRGKIFPSAKKVLILIINICVVILHVKNIMPILWIVYARV